MVSTTPMLKLFDLGNKEKMIFSGRSCILNCINVLQFGEAETESVNVVSSILHLVQNHVRARWRWDNVIWMICFLYIYKPYHSVCYFLFLVIFFLFSSFFFFFFSLYPGLGGVLPLLAHFHFSLKIKIISM